MKQSSPTLPQPFDLPQTRREKLISLNGAATHPAARSLLAVLGDPLEQLLSLDQINLFYQRTREQCPVAGNFFSAAYQAIGLSSDISAADLARIPKQGPVVVTANHPFGGLEAIVLAHLLLQQRPDVKVMANRLLGSMTEILPWLIPVDPFGGPAAARSNIRAMKESLAWLKQGGMLLIFPAGTVSHLHLSERKVQDPPWSEHASALIRRSGATVVPVYVHGQNSWFFQFSGLLHPRVRTALLAREFAQARNKAVRLAVGTPIPPTKCRKFECDKTLTEFLRSSTYMLQNRFHSGGRKSTGGGKFKTVTAAQPTALLAAEIRQLPESARLVQQGEFSVYVAPGNDIPRLLQELGRLRELTFREVGEGTGLESDLDRFDLHYQHLILWNEEQNEIIGAYRLGRAAEILQRYGVRGLYTATLFRFQRPFLKHLHSAIELGRSFIVPHHQRSYGALSLLWRGIGEYVVRHPDCHLVFGPVSISQEYHPVSRQLMLNYMRERLTDPNVSRLVRATRPPRDTRTLGLCKEEISRCLQDTEDVSAWVSSIEPDAKGIPILLKHYINMKAVLLSFNVDRQFSNCLDGLMMTDLRQVDPRVLKRFMGESGWQSFQKNNPSDRVG